MLILVIFITLVTSHQGPDDPDFSELYDEIFVLPDHRVATSLLTQYITVNFDDYLVPPEEGYYSALPIPFGDWRFLNSPNPGVGWPFYGVSVINQTRIPRVLLRSYQKAASSAPNFLLIQEGNLLIESVVSPTFGIYSLVMVTIFTSSQEMTLTSYGLDRQIMNNIKVNITSTPMTIILDWVGFHRLVIGCTNTSYQTCDFVAYDDFVFVK